MGQYVPTLSTQKSQKLSLTSTNVTLMLLLSVKCNSYITCARSVGHIMSLPVWRMEMNTLDYCNGEAAFGYSII